MTRRGAGAIRRDRAVRSGPAALPDDDAAIAAFFASVLDDLPRPTRAGLGLVAVVHGYDDEVPFLDALGAVAPVEVVVSRRPTDGLAAVLAAAPEAVEWRVERSQRAAPASLGQLRSERIVGVDVGGALVELARPGPHLDRMVGIVEEAESGHRSYEAAGELALPVLSVARSPLKGPEVQVLAERSVDALAQAAAEVRGDGLVDLTACVIGYGRVGRALADRLAVRCRRTVVVEVDPLRAIEARAGGHEVMSRADGVAAAEILIGATGRASLDADTLARCRRDAIVGTVTSATAELGADVGRCFGRAPGSATTETLTGAGIRIHLVNGGSSLSSARPGSVGPTIALVQAEVVAAVALLAHDGSPPGLLASSPAVVARIAARWADVFMSAGGVGCPAPSTSGGPR